MRDSEYTPPLSLQKTLRKYQRDGYRWLRTLDGYGMGGILADDMGLGKTVQVLSYLLAMKEGGQQLPSLIVCPASLVLNWQEECQKFTPQLQSVAMDGDAPTAPHWSMGGRRRTSSSPATTCCAGTKNCMPDKAFTPAFWTKRRPSKTTPPRNTRRCAG